MCRRATQSIWRTREGLLKEVTTKQDLEGVRGGPEREPGEGERKEGINEH